MDTYTITSATICKGVHERLQRRYVKTLLRWWRLRTYCRDLRRKTWGACSFTSIDLEARTTFVGWDHSSSWTSSCGRGASS